MKKYENQKVLFQQIWCNNDNNKYKLIKEVKNQK